MYAENNATSVGYDSPMNAVAIGERDSNGNTTIDTAQRTFAQTSAPTVPTRAASLTALLAAINGADGATAAAVFVPIGRVPGRKSYRLSMGMDAVGSDGNQVVEPQYLVYATNFDNVAGVATEPMGTATWTIGTANPAGTGSRASTLESKSVAYAPTNVLANRVGLDPKPTSQLPARLDVKDLGEAIGILRCPYLPAVGGATGAHPYSMKWT